MFKKTLVAAMALSGIVVSGIANASCQDLKERNFFALYGDFQPLSGVLEQSLKNTGWNLRFTQISAEPMIKGQVKDSVQSSIVGLVSKSISQGWNLNLTFDSAKCEVLVDVLNEYAPDTATDIKSVAVKKSKPVAPVDSTIPEGVEKSLASKNVYAVKKGEKLSDVLNTWAVKNGGEAIWMTKHNEIIQADAEFVGGMPGAVSGLMESLGPAGKKYNIRIFKNGYIRVEEAK